MNPQRSLNKFICSDIGGSTVSETNAELPVILPEEFLTKAEADVSADLYDQTPAAPRKHSHDFHQNRQKVRHIAEAKLNHLSAELSKLADELRYYHPLMAEMLDEAWDATEEAISLMDEEG